MPSSDDSPLIVHLIDSLQIGGAQTHLLTMVAHARDHYPYRHRVVGLFGDGPMKADFERLGVPVDLVDLGPAIRSRSFGAATRLVRQILVQHRPLVVEAHLSYSRFFGLPAAWLEGVPVRIGFEQGDIYLSAAKYRVAHRLVQFAAQRIVVCSEALSDWAARVQGLQRSRMTVMHNCVDISAFRPETEALPERFGFSPAATVLCAVGTLGTGVNKRMDVIIRAVQLARQAGADVALVICGDGEQRPALETLIADLGLGDSVKLLGFRRDVPCVLATSDIFCHAAPYEPFGIVCIEAMAMGMPAIVPDSGGLAEVVTPGVTGLRYPALDTDALAKAVCTLHRDRNLCRQMGEAGRQAVLARFTVSAYVQELYRGYAELAKSGVAPAAGRAA